MRFLILSAFLAVAAAAPSGVGVLAPITPIVVPAVKAVVVPAAVPTISPGDIQAAAIDAQVQAQDQAQAAADKARELTELATENTNERAITETAVANEKNVEAFWAAEEKKWQAVDAVKTAEAEIDGAAASSADVLAKSIVSGVSYVAAPAVPVAAHNNLVLPGFYQFPLAVADVKTSHIKTEETKPPVKGEDKESVEIKTAEPEKPAETSDVKKAEEAKPESAEASAKGALNLNEKPALIAQPFLAAPVAVPNLYRYDVTFPAVGVVAQPLFKYGAVHPVPGVIAPTFVKTVW